MDNNSDSEDGLFDGPHSRRSVLEATGKSAVAATALGLGATGNAVAAGPLADKRIYTDGVSISAGESVSSLRDADLALFDSGVSPRRQRVLDALHDGTSFAFVGDYAQHKAIGFLHGLRRGRFAEQSQNGNVERPDDLDFNFGYEIGPNDDDWMTVVHPGDGYLDIRNFHGEGPTSQRDVETSLGESFQSTSDDDVTTQSGWYGDWTRVGTYEDSGSKCDYGQWAVNMDCRKYEDSDKWVAWHTNHRTTGGVEGCGSGWENYERFRDFRFPSWYTLWDYGPYTSTGTTTTSVSISTSDVGASWSYGTADVEVYSTVYEDDVDVEWRHEFTPGTANSEATHTSKETPLVQMPTWVDEAQYSYDATWEWVNTGFWGDDYYEYRRYGDGSWYV